MDEPDPKPSVLERIDAENERFGRPSDSFNQMPLYGWKHWRPWQKIIGGCLIAAVILIQFLRR